MKHVGLIIMVLLFAFAASAQQPVTPLGTCAVIEWQVSRGDSFEIYKNGVFEGVYHEPLWTACREAGTGVYDIDAYYVVERFPNRYGTYTYGPPSYIIAVKWGWDWDYDDNGIVGFSDFGRFVNDFQTNDVSSDSDEDGTVGFSDFGRFVQNFSTCNYHPLAYPWTKLQTKCS